MIVKKIGRVPRKPEAAWQSMLSDGPLGHIVAFIILGTPIFLIGLIASCAE